MVVKYRRHSEVIDAVQWQPGVSHPAVRTDDPLDRPYIETFFGQRIYLKDGDWLVPNEDGKHVDVIGPKNFARLYKAVEE